MFGPCKKDTGRGRVLERFYASISSGVAKSFPAIQESDSGHDQGGRQAGIENRDKRIGKQPEKAGGCSECNHRPHHDPTFVIANGERTIPSLPALDPARVPEIKPPKNKLVEQQKDDCRGCRSERP